MRLRAVAAGVLAVATSLLTVGPAPAYAATGSLCDSLDADSESSESDLVSRPLQLLDVPRAWELLAARGITAGQGVRVAVIDSGVAPAARGRIDVTEPLSIVGGEHASSHGTVVAGLVAAEPRPDGKPVGVAPAAEVVDLRVYADSDDSGSGGIPETNVVAALRWLADNARRERIGVAVTAFELEDSPELAAAVREVVARDVVLVAASGNRPVEGQERYSELGGGPRAGEDVGGTIFPAAYDGVLAVSATSAGVPGDAGDPVLLSSDVDVAVPTYGAVSIGLNGTSCVVQQVATSWSAGIGAGVVALLRSAYPRESAEQIVARLRVTADGNHAAPTRTTGAGVLQPVEALTRVVNPDRRGRVQQLPREGTGTGPVSRPPDPHDPVVATLRTASWWGLVGAGALAVALLLRPLLARRRAPGAQ